MLGAELLDHTRKDVLRDSAWPYLWSDDLIYTRLNEAQILFCRKTHALRDNTSSFTQITTEIGVNEYALDPTVLGISSASISGQVHDMHDKTRTYVPSNLLTSTGLPTVYTTDEATHTLRLYPVPNAVYTVLMRVARKPLVPISDTTSPEIPEEYHLDLVEYAAYRCLRGNDPDGSNAKAAEEYNKTWSQRLSLAKNEYYKFRHGANPTVVNNWTGKR